MVYDWQGNVKSLDDKNATSIVIDEVVDDRQGCRFAVDDHQGQACSWDDKNVKSLVTEELVYDWQGQEKIRDVNSLDQYNQTDLAFTKEEQVKEESFFIIEADFI